MVTSLFPSLKKFYDEDSDLDVLEQLENYTLDNPELLFEGIFISHFDGDLEKIELEKVLENNPFNIFEVVSGLVTVPVESSHLTHIGYNPVWEVLGIRFKNGKGEFRYKNVKKETWKELLKAKSKGGYFAKNIKPNEEKYPYIQVESKLYEMV